MFLDHKEINIIDYDGFLFLIVITGGIDMGSLLEEMHKMRLKEKIEELESIGGNPHVEDHGLGGVYRCKVCGYIFDENREGRPFTTLSHCPICHVGQQQFEKIE